MALLVNGYRENIDFEEWHAVKCGILLYVAYVVSLMDWFTDEIWCMSNWDAFFFPWIDFFFSNKIFYRHQCYVI